MRIVGIKNRRSTVYRIPVLSGGVPGQRAGWIHHADQLSGMHSLLYSRDLSLSLTSDRVRELRRVHLELQGPFVAFTNEQGTRIFDR